MSENMSYAAAIGSVFVVYQVMLWGMCHDNAGVRGGAECSKSQDWLAWFLIVVLPFAVAVGAGVMIASVYM
jgi:H+/Cl- antiporter ClcA